MKPMMSSDQESTRGDGASSADPPGPPSAGERPVPKDRDWHALAAESRPAMSRGRRSASSRPGSTPKPGQLPFGELAVPPASPLPVPSSLGGSQPVQLNPTGIPAQSAAQGKRGVLVAGRFPVAVDPRPPHRLRPGDWATVGVQPATRSFELPAPGAPDDGAGDRTLPVFATQVLAQRLSRLRAGQTLDLEPGEYRGTLTIRTAVTIRIAGDGEVRIRSTTGPAVILKGCGAELVGLTLSSEYSDAIVVESPAGSGLAKGTNVGDGERLELAGCRITAARSGIVVGTTRVRLGVERCEIVAGDGAAIRLPEGAVAAVAESDITSTNGPGITGETGVTLAISGSIISGCGGAGVRLGARASLWMDDGEPATIRRNHGSGIALGPGSKGMIVGATLTGNGGWGLIALDGDVSLRSGKMGDNALGDVKLR